MLSGGSTLVANFAFLDFYKNYVLNVGDSRFIMFDTDTGEIVHTLEKVIDLEDGLVTDYPANDPAETASHLHKVLGKLKVKNPQHARELKQLKGQRGSWDESLAEQF